MEDKTVFPTTSGLLRTGRPWSGSPVFSVIGSDDLEESCMENAGPGSTVSREDFKGDVVSGEDQSGYSGMRAEKNHFSRGFISVFCGFLLRTVFSRPSGGKSPVDKNRVPWEREPGCKRILSVFS